jgi:MFS transporter, NNP family, nitrate/nitrite transporter
LRAGAWATMATALLVAAIVVGSSNLQNFDPALVIYTFASIFATWGIVYHYAVWLQKPPTRRFFERTVELLRRGGESRCRPS